MVKYIIKIPHFYCMEYYEGEKKMIIEMDFRESKHFLSKELITHWEVPYQEEGISEEKKKEILSNIYEFLLSKTIPGNIIMQD